MRAAEGSGARASRIRDTDPTLLRRVRFFALGSASLASSRLRAWRLSEALSAKGVTASTVVGPSSAGARALLRRSDAAVVQKWTPPTVLLALLRATSGRLILDVDDAIYLDDAGRTGAVNDRNRRRFHRNLRYFDGVTVSTDEIAADLRSLRPGLPVLVYPGPIAGTASGVATTRSGGLWLGSPATERYLERWRHELLRIDDAIGFVAVGASARSSELGLATLPWTFDVERTELRSRSVGIFVQSRGRWEDRKSGYKLLEYIAAGVVPVAERIPASVAILGDDYPYLVENRGLADAVLAAARLDAAARDELLTGLRERIAPATFDAVATRWIDFVIGLTG